MSGVIQPHQGILTTVNHDPFNNSEFPQTLRNKYDVDLGQKLLIDLSYIADIDGFKKVQTVFIDNTDNDCDVILINYYTDQRIVCKANRQGYYPVLCTDKPKFYLSHNGNLKINLPIIFMNFLIAQGEW